MTLISPSGESSQMTLSPDVIPVRFDVRDDLRPLTLSFELTVRDLPETASWNPAVELGVLAATQLPAAGDVFNRGVHRPLPFQQVGVFPTSIRDILTGGAGKVHPWRAGARA